MNSERRAVVCDVPLYAQHRTNLCWAYCIIMREEYLDHPDGGFASQDEADARARALSAATYEGKSRRRRYNHSGRVPADDAGVPASIDALVDLLEKHGPVFGIFHAWFWNHCVLVTGADADTDTVYVNDPHGHRLTMTWAQFLKGKGLSRLFRYRLLRIRVPRKSE